MKSQVGVDAQRILLLIKLDATSLMNRIQHRAPEYLGYFFLKRTRDHFPEIFSSRYERLGIDTIKLCGEESIFAIDAFYNKSDEMRWYLCYTEDMTNQVDDEMGRHIRELEKLFETLCLYIDAELGYQND